MIGADGVSRPPGADRGRPDRAREVGPAPYFRLIRQRRFVPPRRHHVQRHDRHQYSARALPGRMNGCGQIGASREFSGLRARARRCAPEVSQLRYGANPRNGPCGCITRGATTVRCGARESVTGRSRGDEWHDRKCGRGCVPYRTAAAISIRAARRAAGRRDRPRCWTRGKNSGPSAHRTPVTRSGVEMVSRITIPGISLLR
jgi:hypothetical protein